MDKSVGAFRTISEVADDLDLPQHVLRFWETRFPQIRPLKRAGGRRYYRPADVDLLRIVRDLLYGEGYTIKGVQRLLRERNGKGVRDGSAGEGAFAAGGDGALPGDGSLDGDEAQDGDGVPAGNDIRAGAAAALARGPRDRAPEPRPVTPSDAGDGDPASLLRALALIEDCERVLRAALSPMD